MLTSQYQKITFKEFSEIVNNMLDKHSFTGELSEYESMFFYDGEMKLETIFYNFVIVNNAITFAKTWVTTK